MRAKNWSRWSKTSTRAALLVAIVLGSGNGDVIAQGLLDLCGCAGASTLDFNAGNPATYPPGTSGCSSPCTSGTIVFTLPPDGVMKFKSFTANGDFPIRFSGNANNTPVSLLIAGDVLLRGTNGCCQNLHIGGGSGSSGGNGTAGVGGLGGPGGFRGGDGAAFGVNLVLIGGAGQGPGGGVGANQTTTAASGGTFISVPELLPLIGGSGGGGGASTGTDPNPTCTGGGGGGGGGAILIAANGTVTLQNYDIIVDGGPGGSVGNGAGCARGGSGGSGGAIRLVAKTVVDNGNGRLWAQGGGQQFNGNNGTPGRIRIESIDASAQTNFQTFPTSVALRITGPGPLSNPVAPTVKITHVNGNPVPEPPQGYRGSIDLILPAPGVVSVNIATTGVPSGTTVEVKSKPRIGADPQAQTIPLTNCDTQGACLATATLNLNAGATVLEARATFQVQ